MSCLIVVAHPDDELLGCGGTAAAMVRKGRCVRTCILSESVDARQDRPPTDELTSDMLAAHATIGLGPPLTGTFPNIGFNLVSQLELVQFIEAAIVETDADTIFTHHPADLNSDHAYTSSACQAAARLFQRGRGRRSLEALYFMEILSSTDWAFRGGGASFTPDTFMEIGDTLDVKIEALRKYRGVMREFPHPRSEEIIRGLAAYRGGQAGLRYAEAFQTAFRRLSA